MRHPRVGQALPPLGVVLAALLLPALAGCSDLPVIAPDDPAAPPLISAPVPLTGARGPLTAAQSAAILTRLSHQGEASDIFERHLAREEALVSSPLTTGNQVLLLQDGPATYRAMWVAIAAARHHIHMETYILDDDAIGQQFAQALIDKQRQGVQVRLIRDSEGTWNTPDAFFERLTASGIQVLEFNPVNPLRAQTGWSLNQRDHRKLLIVDGEVAFLGGINISSVYSGGSFSAGGRAARVAAKAAASAATNAPQPPAWRDTDVRLQGPVVAELQKLFLATWASQQGTPLPADPHDFPPPSSPGRLVVRAIGSAPDEPFSLIYATLLSAIASAETSIQLTNAYFVPDPQLLAALAAAVQRGVAVTLILPSRTDSWLVFHAGRAYYEPLLRAGVQIYERRDVVLHAKTVLIDGVWATVGSTNLDWRSFLHNQEVNAVVLGADFGQQLQTVFDQDLAASDPILLAPWQRRGLDLRLKEWLARIWAYWL